MNADGYLILDGHFDKNSILWQWGTFHVKMSRKTGDAEISDGHEIVAWGKAPRAWVGWTSVLYRVEHPGLSDFVDTLGWMAGSIFEAGLGKYTQTAPSMDMSKFSGDFRVRNQYVLEASVFVYRKKTLGWYADFHATRHEGPENLVIMGRDPKLAGRGSPGGWKRGMVNAEVFPEHYAQSDEPYLEFVDKFLNMLLELMAPPPSARGALGLTRRPR